MSKYTTSNEHAWFDPKAQWGDWGSTHLVTPSGIARWHNFLGIKGWFTVNNKPFPLPALVRQESAKEKQEKKAINFEELWDIALAKDEKQASKEWDDADFPAWDDMNVTQQTAACNLAERQGLRFMKLMRKFNAKN